MLHAKFQDPRTFGSGEEEFYRFLHIWGWQPSWSSMTIFTKFMFNLPMKAPHKIWL